MLDKASAPSETPLTLITCVRHEDLNTPLGPLHPPLILTGPSTFRILNILITVDPPMPQEMRIPPKGLAACVALIWLLPRVDSVMFEEAAALAEGLPAVLTLVGLLPSVSSLVLDEV